MGDSLIPDVIGNTLNDVIGLYKQVEATKLQISLAKAQASLASMENASAYQNAQARAASYTETANRAGAGLSNAGMVVVGLLALGAVYLLAKG